MARRLLYFRADGCAVCQHKRPVAAEIAEEMGLSLEVVDTATDAGHQLAEHLRIHTVPTLALVDGERVPFRLVGRLISAENARHLATLTRPPGRS